MAAGRQGKKRRRRKARRAAADATRATGAAIVAGSLVERLYREVGNRHHVVPRAHLCRFAKPGTAATLRELDVATGAIRDRKAGKATVVPLINHLDPRKEWRGGSFEAIWQIEEGLISPVFDRLVAGQEVTPPSFEVLSRYTIMLHTRNPVWLEAWRDANASIKGGLGGRSQRLGAAWLLADWMAPVFAKWYEWNVVSAPPGSAYIIGDIPVGAYRRVRGGVDSEPENLFTAEVIFEDEFEIYMPIEPKACLVVKPSSDPNLATAGQLVRTTADAGLVSRVNRDTARRSSKVFASEDRVLTATRDSARAS